MTDPVDVEALRAAITPVVSGWTRRKFHALLDEVSALRAVNAELRAAACDAWSSHAGEIVGLQRDWSQANARAEEAEAQVAALQAQLEEERRKFQAETVTTSYLAQRLATRSDCCDRCYRFGIGVLVINGIRHWLCLEHLCGSAPS